VLRAPLAWSDVGLTIGHADGLRSTVKLSNIAKRAPALVGIHLELLVGSPCRLQEEAAWLQQVVVRRPSRSVSAAVVVECLDHLPLVGALRSLLHVWHA
jgi:hypothetical protein